MLSFDLQTLMGVASLLLAAVGVYLAIVANAHAADIYRLLRTFVEGRKDA